MSSQTFRPEFDDVDLEANELFNEYLEERKVLTLTIRVLEILRKDLLISNRQSVGGLRISLIQEISHASDRWKESLEIAKKYIIEMLADKNITVCNTVSQLFEVLRERLRDIPVSD